jgi:hypothetical protein
MVNRFALSRLTVRAVAKVTAAAAVKSSRQGKGATVGGIGAAFCARGWYGSPHSWAKSTVVLSPAHVGMGARSFHEDKLPNVAKKLTWDMDVFHESISETERKSIIAAFDLIDEDENGVIDKHEQEALKLILTDAGFDFQDVSKCIIEMDLDRNGEISREEFIEWYVHLHSQKHIHSFIHPPIRQSNNFDPGINQSIN